MNLSVKDVAGLLNLSEKTIYRMIQNETIPCFRVGGQWRFDRQELKSWMEDARQFSVSTAEQDSSEGEEELISVSEFLQRGGVHDEVPGSTKDEAIQLCLERIREVMPDMDVKKLFGLIMEREELCPTAVGHGIALPHPGRFTDAGALSSIALCRLESPIPFGALDNEDVDTLFFIFPKTERRFLRIEAKLLRLLRDEEVLETVKEGTQEAIYETLSRKEAEIFRVVEQ